MQNGSETGTRSESEARNVFKTVWYLLSTTIEEWNADHATQMAASLAYYTIFSIAPLLIIATAIAGRIYGSEVAREQILFQIAQYTDPQIANLVGTIVGNASAPRANTIATIIGVLVLIFGASNVFVALKYSLDRIWDVPVPFIRSWREAVVHRIMMLLMVFLCGLLLFVSLVLSVVVTGASEWIDVYWPLLGGLSRFSNFMLFFVITVFVFALIYKYMPDVRLAWRDVFLGALATSLLFSIGRYLISMYLRHSSISSTFGTAGSLVVLLLWIYYSAQLFFLGAEFTQVYARTRGSRVQEHELLEGAGDDPDETQLVPRTTRWGQNISRHTRQAFVDLVLAVGVMSVVSLTNFLREPFRKE